MNDMAWIVSKILQLWDVDVQIILHKYKGFGYLLTWKYVNIAKQHVAFINHMKERDWYTSGITWLCSIGIIAGGDQEAAEGITDAINQLKFHMLSKWRA